MVEKEGIEIECATFTPPLSMGCIHASEAEQRETDIE